MQNEKLRSIESRLAIWQQVPAVIRDSPWWGVGFDNIEMAFAPHRPSQLVNLENPEAILDRSHNVFFDLLIQTGIMGTVLFILFLITSARQILPPPRLTSLQQGLFASLFGVGVAWQFGFPVVTDSVLFFLILGILMIKPHDTKKHRAIPLWHRMLFGSLCGVFALLSIYGAVTMWIADRDRLIRWQPPSSVAAPSSQPTPPDSRAQILP